MSKNRHVCTQAGTQAAGVGCWPKVHPAYAHLSVLRTASTSGMLALREMALSSLSSWLLSSRYLFLKQRFGGGKGQELGLLAQHWAGPPPPSCGENLGAPQTPTPLGGHVGSQAGESPWPLSPFYPLDLSLNLNFWLSLGEKHRSYVTVGPVSCTPTARKSNSRLWVPTCQGLHYNSLPNAKVKGQLPFTPLLYCFPYSGIILLDSLH